MVMQVAPQSRKKIFAWFAVALIVAGAASIRFFYINRTSARKIVLTGAVLRNDADLNKQTPIANVMVSSLEEHTLSDASGRFTLTVYPELLANSAISLRFEHAGYKPLEIPAGAKGTLYIARMQPLANDSLIEVDHDANQTAIKIANLRVRYSVNDVKTINVGTVAKEFEVVNAGNVPCQSRPPCSPDGRWKASTGNVTLDTQKDNEFRNVRASCIAGPCPFTRLQPANLPGPVRTVQITALDWSDTASFLVEAEVTRTMATESIRQSFPFLTGKTMTFVLPVGAEGPSVVADLKGEEIVFPLGPKAILSWATCNVETAPGPRTYRCELKPGYEFQQ